MEIVSSIFNGLHGLHLFSEGVEMISTVMAKPHIPPYYINGQLGQLANDCQGPCGSCDAWLHAHYVKTQHDAWHYQIRYVDE